MRNLKNNVLEISNGNLKILISMMLLFFTYNLSGQKTKLTCKDGFAEFISEAPLEIIKAHSEKLTGVLDTTNHSFTFAVPSSSFYGFNSPLQRDHFNLNYMESEKYPNTTFTGKIIEPIDYSKKGVYDVRAKGQLTIHGITQDKIVKAKLSISNSTILVESGFSVNLSDFDINIPKVVKEKVALDIVVNIKAEMK